jgi:hypothetical protein
VASVIIAETSRAYIMDIMDNDRHSLENSDLSPNEPPTTNIDSGVCISNEFKRIEFCRQLNNGKWSHY